MVSFEKSWGPFWSHSYHTNFFIITDGNEGVKVVCQLFVHTIVETAIVTVALCVKTDFGGRGIKQISFISEVIHLLLA